MLMFPSASISAMLKSQLSEFTPIALRAIRTGVRNGNVSVPVRVAAEAGGQVFKIGNSAKLIGRVQFTVGIPAEEAA